MTCRATLTDRHRAAVQSVIGQRDGWTVGAGEQADCAQTDQIDRRPDKLRRASNTKGSTAFDLGDRAVLRPKVQIDGATSAMGAKEFDQWVNRLIRREVENDLFGERFDGPL